MHRAHIEPLPDAGPADRLTGPGYRLVSTKPLLCIDRHKTTMRVAAVLSIDYISIDAEIGFDAAG
jgi:hypothetical protein